LEKYHGVNLFLQKNDGCINLYNVQMLFNKLIGDFGEAFKHYLSPNADIVACPQFKAAIVNCISRAGPLTNADKELLKCSEVETLDLKQNKVEELNSVWDGINALLKGCKWQRTASSMTYIDLKLIPNTNKNVERFFCQGKFNMT
jgi:hypothetical protein